jgi:hypothetical protein
MGAGMRTAGWLECLLGLSGIVWAIFLTVDRAFFFPFAREFTDDTESLSKSHTITYAEAEPVVCFLWLAFSAVIWAVALIGLYGDVFSNRGVARLLIWFAGVGMLALALSFYVVTDALLLPPAGLMLLAGLCAYLRGRQEGLGNQESRLVN